MADATFFDAPTAASLKKHRIVSKYFGGWANIVLPNALKREGKIMYVDLYSGPGQYRDGTRSTPLLVLDHVIKTPALRDTVELFYNDENSDFTRELETHIAETPGVEGLRHRPKVRNRAVGRDIVPLIRKTAVDAQRCRQVRDLNGFPTAAQFTKWVTTAFSANTCG